jgi:hypothetical protein
MEHRAEALFLLGYCIGKAASVPFGTGHAYSVAGWRVCATVSSCGTSRSATLIAIGGRPAACELKARVARNKSQERKC